MKIKAVISTTLAILLCFMMLPVSASAGTAGDVDASGKVDATDARLALRAAVGLESLSAEAQKAADVDFNGVVNATDARIILRAAVGLEKLPEAGEDEPAPDTHTHSFKTVSVTGKTKCSADGCDAELPSFNDMVNVLKDYEKIDYFTGIFEDVSHYDAPVLGGMLAGMMEEGDELTATTETTYAPLVVDRLVTNNNFHSKGADFVSALSDSDVKSISIKRADTVDFVKALPASFKSGKTEYDISAIKAYSFPEMYKITLVLPSQTFDIAKPVKGASVFDKIYTKDYNTTLESMRAEVSSGIDSLAKELEGLESMLKMKTDGDMTATLTVEYFVTADSFTPVAAKYSHALDVEFDVRVTDPIGGVKYLTMLQKMDMKTNLYYFFNNSFGM